MGAKEFLRSYCGVDGRVHLAHYPDSPRVPNECSTEAEVKYFVALSRYVIDKFPGDEDLGEVVEFYIRRLAHYLKIGD